MSELIKARWVAGFPAVMADGTPLVPDETVVQLPEAEARASENWEVEQPAALPKPKAKTASSTEPEPQTETTAPEGS